MINVDQINLLPEFLNAFATQKSEFRKNLLAKAWRNKLLALSDWTQSADSPLTDEKKAEWATYRQALRDITDQPSYPENIQWPTKPE